MIFPERERPSAIDCFGSIRDARYRFFLQNGETYADPDGEILDDDDAAKKLAALVAAELRRGRTDHQDWSIVVRREDGSEVTRIMLKDVEYWGARCCLNLIGMSPA